MNFITPIKSFFKSLIILTLVALIVFIWYSLPIISGYGAKVMCSDVYLSHRDPIVITNEDLGSFPFNLGTYKVNRLDSSVTGSVFGLAIRKAIYRKGLGATLIVGINEQELRQQIKSYQLAKESPTTTELWPMGDEHADTILNTINTSLLDSTLSQSFQYPSTRRTRAVLVIYKGKIIRERYLNGFNKTTMMAGWSMAKSITNALTGILIKKNLINLNTKNLFPQWSEDSRKDITLADVLHLSSGLKWSEFYAGPSDVTNMLYKQYNMGAYALNKEINSQPGNDFYYSSGSANIISLKIRQILGDSNYYLFPYNDLFRKIGMNHTILEPDASGTFVGSSYCYATARDFARFGLLFLNDGIWNGERILPEGWVKFSTATTDKRNDPRWGKFGALWWVNKGDVRFPLHRRYPDVPEDCYSAMGYEGQSIWIIPSKDLVIVRLSCEHGNKLNANDFLHNIISSLPN